MRFGNCTAPADAAALKAIGYDFGEMPIVYALQPEQAEPEIMPTVRTQIANAGLAPDVWYLFLPGDLKLIGDVDTNRLTSYVEAACARVSSISGKVIVFGSAGARQIPEGVTAQQAHYQLVHFLRQAGEVAAPMELVIAIEPMCARVCNHINTIAEAVALVREAGHPALGITADIYHMTEDNQSLEEIREAGELLAHVHVAGDGRRAPIEADIPRLVSMFRILKDMKYEGRIAIEAQWEDVNAQAAEALEVMQRAWKQA